VSLSPGETHARQTAILEALSPAARTAHAVLLGELGLPTDAEWYALPSLRRVFEQAAWLQLTARAERRGLTRWPAERWAAEQLRCNVRTFQTRLRGKTPVPPFT